MLELASTIILGIAAQWAAWRLRLPAILPLILTGLVVGPISTLFTADGEKLIQPIYDGTRGLFPGKSLFYFVSLSIGVILFEGGLTLRRSEIRDVGPAILRLILVGSLVTFLGAGVAAKFIIPELSWSIALLFSALIIVTGPTVIAPILQNVPLTRNVSTVLKWEGILIDPIGALTAVLVFEFITKDHTGTDLTYEAVQQIFLVIGTGAIIGIAAAYGLAFMIRKELIPHFLINVFSLALVLLTFVISDLIAHESGLVTVVIMGVVLGNLDIPLVKEILFFKESLSVLLISILFIILAANIDMADLELLMDWRCAVLFSVVVFVLRPLGVFLSTVNAGLKFNERLFVSWVGPRGIVAAGIASLFGLQLIEKGVPYAEYIVPLVFMIVLGTVVLNATTAKFMAKILKVEQDTSGGILIVGANTLSRVIGKYLKGYGRRVVLVDNSKRSIDQTRKEGLEALQADIFTDTLTSAIDLVDMGYLIALTSNSDINNYAIRKYRKVFGENGTFRLISESERRLDKAAMPKNNIFSYRDDFINFSNIARDYPTMYEMEVDSNEHLKDLMGFFSKEKLRAPVFLRFPDGIIDTIPCSLKEIEVPEGTKLAYIGKELEQVEERKLEVVKVER